MELWMSAEAMADVADSYRTTRIKVEKAINARLSSDFNLGGMKRWAVIVIIRPDDHPDYPELSKLHRARKVVEFRLKVDHEAFLRGDEKKRITLLGEMLLRSLDGMTAMKLPSAGIEELRRIVVSELLSP